MAKAWSPATFASGSAHPEHKKRKSRDVDRAARRYRRARWRRGAVDDELVALCPRCGWQHDAGALEPGVHDDEERVVAHGLALRRHVADVAPGEIHRDRAATGVVPVLVGHLNTGRCEPGDVFHVVPTCRPTGEERILPKDRMCATECNQRPRE